MDAINLSLRQLRAFVAVARAGSFTGAARELHLTQSAISVLVRELEHALNVPLFDRHTRRVLLSEAGREFLPSVQRVLDDLQRAVGGMSDLREKKRGLLRLAAPQLMACTLMPRVIGAYRARFPDVDVRLADTLPELLLAGLADGKVELAVGQDVPVDSSVERQLLLRDRACLICPADHPFARRRSVRWRELAPYPFIAPTRDFRQRVLSVLDDEGRAMMQRPGTQEVSYMTTALGMVAAGLGLTVCPTYSAPLVRMNGLVMVQLVGPAFHREVCFYRSAGRSLSPAAQSFVELLQQTVREGPAKAAVPSKPARPRRPSVKN